VTGATWLLLIHQIPAKPDYLRVRIGRRLQQMGAVAVKSSVYALPNLADCREDFQWILREVTASGGEAVLCAVELVEGLDDEQLREAFRDARRRDYAAIGDEAREALRVRDPTAEGDAGARAAHEGPPAAAFATVSRLERRLEAVQAIDFFDAAEREQVRSLIDELRMRLQRGGSGPPAGAGHRPAGATWVTRAGVEEDRIASAWLIRRFIDPAARFRFVGDGAALDDDLPADAIRFDMFEAEHTHEGDRCTFEVLLERYRLDDAALAAIGEIVHDVDLADEKFGRPETAGIDRLIRGLVRVERDDEARVRAGGALFDALYAAFSAAPRGAAAP
jgi:hypothetical protein